MKRLLAILLLAGVALFSAAPAEAANKNGNNHNHSHNGHNHGNYGRSYRNYPYGIYSSYGYPYGYGYGSGYYGRGFVNYGYPGAVFVSPQSFGFGPGAVQNMFGF